MGRKAMDGSFDDFVRAVTNAGLTVDRLKVKYDAPGLGMTTFDWEGPFVVGGNQIPLRDYPRWDNPYAQVEFGNLKYAIEFGGMSLMLDFENALRTIK